MELDGWVGYRRSIYSCNEDVVIIVDVIEGEAVNA
jgi:hypothetical protein